MSIFNFFKDFTLTPNQKSTLEKLDVFLHSDKQVFIIKGYAGTGKTTLLKGISEYLEKVNRLGHIMAPTGRAAKVIKEKTKYSATTIHKFIYDLKNLKTYRHIDKDDNETFKFYFDFPSGTSQLNKVYIFDESSMISNVFSEGEFFRFGSGFLLNDIIKYFNLNALTNTKLIFVGDPAQLPPVGSIKSEALNASFFESKKILFSETEMTDVVRQNIKSGILFNANYYRKLIFSEKVAENNLNLNFDDIKEIDLIQLKSIFTNIAPLPDISKAIIITFSNALAFTYNRLIREEYFPNSKKPEMGDLLQIIKNNYRSQDVELLNGDFVKILSISDTTEFQSARIKKKSSKDVVIRHEFRDAQIIHSSGKIVDVKLLDSLLNSKNRDLNSDEMKALYINFIMRYKERTGGVINKKSEQFKEAFRNDAYFNALQVKYGYAITGHKSQGGEWENVFIDFSGRVGTYIDALRWDYTTITRASKNLFVLNPPGLKQIDFSKLNIKIGNIKKLPKNAIHYPDIPATPFHSEKTNPAKRVKYQEIKEKLNKLDYKINNVISNPYQETYTIGANDEIITIMMHHNAEGVFTSYASNNSTNTAIELLNLIKQNSPWPYAYNYKTDDTLSKDIHNNILSAMEDLKISILGIDDTKKSEYHIDYFFRTEEAQGAYLQIYFNKNERVTNVIAKSMLGENDLTLKKLIENLKN